MADTPQTLALLALGQRLRGKAVNNINRRSGMLRTLQIKKGEGKNIAWNAKGSGQIAENFAEGADAANFGSDSQAQALLTWARVWSPFHVNGSAIRAASSNGSGPDGMADLIGENLVDSTAAVASLINQQIFSGTGSSNQLTGLDVAIGSTSNTYATIDRTSATYWRPYVADPGSLTTLTFNQIRTDKGAIYDACGENPDIAVVPTAVFNTIGALYDDNRRYLQQVVNTPRGMVKLDAGFEGLEFEGMVILKDKDATANQIYYLNTNHVWLEYQPLDPSTVAALASMGVTMGADDGYGVTPLGIRVEKLAKNGDSERVICLSELNLVVRRPNACGIRKNVAIAT